MHLTTRSRTVRIATLLVALILSSAGATTLAHTPTPSESGSVTVGTLLDATGKNVGSVALSGGEGGHLQLTVIVTGLAPGEHGVHLHEAGACDPSGDKPFASAGAHFNPGGMTHGMHAGDLGNLTADAEGDALYTATNDQLTAGMASSLADADGAALVIHETDDDLKTDPSGNSGARIACAVLFAGATTGATTVGDPAGCTVARRSYEELQVLFAGVTATEPVLPAEIVIPTGKPADAATAASVRATVNRIIACFNSGDMGRVLALFTSEAIVAIFPWLGQEMADHPEQMRAQFDAGQPVPAESWQRVVAITDIVALPDGRVGAMLVNDDLQSERARPEAIHLILAADGEGWLVDEARFFSGE